MPPEHEPRRVSLIIPAYNAVKWLDDALDSVFQDAATAPGWLAEVIVVDDGSTDGTASVAARWQSRVRYVRTPNRGPSAARNIGASLARHEWLTFLDADDFWTVGRIPRFERGYRERPDSDVIMGMLERGTCEFGRGISGWVTGGLGRGVRLRVRRELDAARGI